MSSEQKDFWEFILKTNPELIKGFRNKFVCVVCMEEVSGNEAVVCENGHNACCVKCNNELLRRMNTDKCPVCRCDNTIKKIVNHEVENNFLKNRLHKIKNKYSEENQKMKKKKKKKIQIMNQQFMEMYNSLKIENEFLRKISNNVLDKIDC